MNIDTWMHIWHSHMKDIPLGVTKCVWIQPQSFSARVDLMPTRTSTYSLGFCSLILWKQHSKVSIFHFSYFFGFKSTKQYWVKLFGTKFVLLDTNQSTDSIQQIRISELVDWQVKILKNCEIFHHICRHTWIAFFYLCTDPLRAESQIRRDIKFVISILFEVSITSWDASTLVLLSGV